MVYDQQLRKVISVFIVNMPDNLVASGPSGEATLSSWMSGGLISPMESYEGFRMYCSLLLTMPNLSTDIQCTQRHTL